MNPVLLKPQSEIGAQIVVQGQVYGTAQARAEYQAMKPKLLPHVLESFARLKAEADLVLVEGAGSASEINLRANDIANMGFARAADVPVVLIGDIDRGGVIASLVGTKAVLDPTTRRWSGASSSTSSAAIRSLFADGMAAIARRTGWPALGLVPYFAEARHAAGRGRAGARRTRGPPSRRRALKIAVPILPQHRQFRRSRSAATRSRDVELVARASGQRRCPAMPTSSSCPARRRPSPTSPPCATAGCDIDIAAHVRRGGTRARAVRRLPDARPHHRRSGRHRRARPARREGLGLLDVDDRADGREAAGGG